MRKMFISASMLICGITLFAQENKLPSFMDFYNKEKQFKSFAPRVTAVPKLKGQNFNIDNLQSGVQPGSAKPLMILQNGNKVSILPQDNMPCVIPDLSQFNMPVAIVPNNMDEKINASKGND
jgi:hypothetical protein